MLGHVRNVDFASIVFTGIILFFTVFLGWIIVRQILRPLIFPTAEEATSPVFKNTRFVPLLMALGIIYGPFLAGMWWSWNKTAFFLIETDGGWTFRNSYYIALLRIPSDRPRQIEASLQREVSGDSASEYFYSGKVYVLLPSGVGVAMNVTCDEKNGQPDLFQKFGFANTAAYATGPHGGPITPLHTWSASGPAFIAEDVPIHSTSSPK